MGSQNHAVAISLHDGAALPETLKGGLTAERAALWQVERTLWTPRTFVARDADGAVLGATLTASRPFTAYRKIVDAIAGDDAVWATLVSAAMADAPTTPSEERPEPIAIFFEEHLSVAPLSDARRARLADLGFAKAAQPVPTVPSTRSGERTYAAAWAWWRGDRPTRLAPYYGQTTDVTCGAVSALMGLESLGNNAFNDESLADNRALELGFWRRATNLPACEPIGLAVETAAACNAIGLSSTPSVLLSVEGPVLLEPFVDSEFEYGLRVDLQQESLRQAQAAGIPIERRWVEIDEIVQIVDRGDQALLLIDLTELIADPTPHWVLATDVVNGSLVISDPWVQSENGETWVDTFAMPLPFATVDRVTRWGDPAYRGIVVVPGRGA